MPRWIHMKQPGLSYQKLSKRANVFKLTGLIRITTNCSRWSFADGPTRERPG